MLALARSKTIPMASRIISSCLTDEFVLINIYGYEEEMVICIENNVMAFEM